MGIERMNPTAAEHSSSSSSSRSSAAFSATTETPAAAPPGPGVTVGGGDVASPPDEQDVTTSSQLSAAAAQGSSRFVGVVPQPNGRWGAQIYDRHDRVWLGTFAIKDAAARAYDVAALRYRGREAATNFPDAGASAPELAFLAAHSKAEIVDMLRKHTYADELRQSLRRGGGGRGRGMGTRAQPTPASARVLLFEKAVTPSDVGRLNRLVLPKQHAEKHLKPRPEAAAAGGKGGVLLNFEDGEGKVWRFRYSYWNSSHSHVLTKGWSRFVREKGLRAGDTIVFSHTTYGSEKQLFIHCKKSKVDGVPVPPSAETPSDAARVRVVRLFGVDIAGEGCQKRARPVEKIPFKHGLQELLKSKKQCLGHHRSPAKGVGSLVPRRVAMVGKHNI